MMLSSHGEGNVEQTLSGAGSERTAGLQGAGGERGVHSLLEERGERGLLERLLQVLVPRQRFKRSLISVLFFCALSPDGAMA